MIGVLHANGHDGQHPLTERDRVATTPCLAVVLTTLNSIGITSSAFQDVYDLLNGLVKARTRLAKPLIYMPMAWYPEST